MMNCEARPLSPSFHLTEGHSVVGPIDAHLLLRGITSGETQSADSVEQATWGGIPASWLSGASSAGEALFFALHAAVMATGALAGLIHREREPFIGLVTSSVHGAGTYQELGQIIARHDPALAAARQRRTVIGSPDQGEAERAIARRFSMCGPRLAAVAMVPVHDGDRLLAMLELARIDGPFLHSDTAVLQTIATAVCLP
jgi:GAF domain-containing protein